MPTIDLTDAEHAAVTALIQRAIETDRFPRAPRLDSQRASLARLDAAVPEPTPTLRPRRQPKPTSGRRDKPADRSAALIHSPEVP
jgi:transposase